MDKVKQAYDQTIEQNKKLIEIAKSMGLDYSKYEDAISKAEQMYKGYIGEQK